MGQFCPLTILPSGKMKRRNNEAKAGFPDIINLNKLLNRFYTRFIIAQKKTKWPAPGPRVDT